MNELVKVEENQIIIAERVIEQIKDFERKRKLIEQKEQDFKEQLLKAMEEHNLKSYESPDKSLKITYIPESLSTTFDSKAFRDYDFDTYQKFLKDVNRKASIRMTIRENEEG